MSATSQWPVRRTAYDAAAEWFFWLGEAANELATRRLIERVVGVRLRDDPDPWSAHGWVA